MLWIPDPTRIDGMTDAGGAKGEDVLNGSETVTWDVACRPETDRVATDPTWETLMENELLSN